MRNHFLFIANYPLDTLSTGPKVRIDSLKREFLKKCELIFLCGTPWSRFEQYFKFILNKKYKQVKNAYIEPSTSTAWPGDLLFLIYLKYKKIKISIYIRDAYPKFPEFWNELKFYQYPLYLGWYVSIWIYLKIADISYYPTSTLMSLFNHRNADLLPPGSNSLINKFSANSNTILYAGNLNSRYGENILIDMMKELGKHYKQFRLILVTTAVTNSDLFESLGIKVMALSLSEIIKNKDDYFIAIIPRVKNDYNDLALPIKLFDYMGLGLPILASNCNEQNKFIRENGLGVICNADPIDFSSNILKIHSDKDSLNHFHSNVVQAVNTKHSWSKRAEKVLKDFQKLENLNQ